MTDSNKPRYAFFDGDFVPFENAKVSVMTHAFNYGTGVFEGIRGYWNDDHQRLYLVALREHYSRLRKNSAMMCIALPYTVDELIDMTVRLVTMNEFSSDVYIRPIAYKSSEQIGVSMEGVADAFTLIAAPFGNYVDIDRGLSVTVSSWQRTADNAIPGRAKVTGNYANTALVKNEAVMNGYDEGLVLNHLGHVIEGSAENLFLVRDNVLLTPGREEGILEGITRDIIIRLAAAELDCATIERPIARSELYYADEIFLTGTGAQVAPVTQVDRRKVGNGQVGPISRALQKMYFDVVRGRNNKYASLLTPAETSAAGQRAPVSVTAH